MHFRTKPIIVERSHPSASSTPETVARAIATRCCCQRESTSRYQSVIPTISSRGFQSSCRLVYWRVLSASKAESTFYTFKCGNRVFLKYRTHVVYGVIKDFLPRILLLSRKPNEIFATMLPQPEGPRCKNSSFHHVRHPFLFQKLICMVNLPTGLVSKHIHTPSLLKSLIFLRFPPT